MAVGARPQTGFTLIELMMAVAIVGILSAIALGQWRDYTRRARMAEVVLATSNCKSRVSESYLSLAEPPRRAGIWGCEPPATSRYVTAVETSVDGAIRVTIGNLDATVNGLHMHLVPVRGDGATALSSTQDLGSAVPQWVCGSDAKTVRNALPPECRADSSAYASASFENGTP